MKPLQKRFLEEIVWKTGRFRLKKTETGFALRLSKKYLFRLKTNDLSIFLKEAGLRSGFTFPDEVLDAITKDCQKALDIKTECVFFPNGRHPLATPQNLYKGESSGYKRLSLGGRVNIYFKEEQPRFQDFLETNKKTIRRFLRTRKIYDPSKEMIRDSGWICYEEMYAV